MIQISFWGDCKINDTNKVSLQKDIQSILDKSDLNVVNFEAPVHTKSKKIKKEGPVISQSKKTPVWLEKHGFNVISLANNHMMDFGEEGLFRTIEHFQNSLLVGAGKWAEAYKVCVVSLNDIKIGFLALTHHEFGVLSDVYDDKNDTGTAWVSHPNVASIIVKAKKELDFLFVLPHAWIEHIDFPLPEWRDIYRGFIDLGADAVIASHPHVPQGWEVYKNKMIFYSLGNFCFQKDELLVDRPYWNESLCVVLKIDNAKKLEMEVKHISYRNNEIVVRTDAEIVNHIKEVNRCLEDESLYIATINQHCQNLLKSNVNRFSAGGFHYISGLNTNSLKKIISIFTGRLKIYPHSMVNGIRCESHRWAYLRAIKTKSDIF